jgi:fermentation-respiration switch protein FrsA (DUF1100 family)
MPRWSNKSSVKKRRSRSCLKSILAALFFFAALLIGLTAWISHRWAQIYLHPTRYIVNGDALTANGIEYRDIELTTSDGVKLSAWYTPAKNGAIILVAHGYGAARSEFYHALFARHGFGVVSWDFRAHGESGGDFSTLGYYEQLDVEAALDFALAQPGVNHIGAWGGSMGGATIILTAARRAEIEALAIDSSFPTLEDVYQLNVPFPLFQPMVRFFAERGSGVSADSVRPVDEIGKIAPRAVFVIQGNGDVLASIRAGERLFENAREPKLLWTEAGVPHLGMSAYYPSEYETRVIGFFEEYLK